MRVPNATTIAHYKIQFTISRDTHDKLRRAQDLLRHAIPDGDPAKIFDRALTLLLADVERKKVAAVAKPPDHQRQHLGTGRTFRRASGAKSGSVTAANARSSAGRDVATSAGFSSFITDSHLPPVVR